ncbi:protein of unknown function (plasmid) [Caballeronia sp. S22]
MQSAEVLALETFRVSVGRSGIDGFDLELRRLHARSEEVIHQRRFPRISTEVDDGDFHVRLLRCCLARRS